MSLRLIDAICKHVEEPGYPRGRVEIVCGTEMLTQLQKELDYGLGLREVRTEYPRHDDPHILGTFDGVQLRYGFFQEPNSFQIRWRGTRETIYSFQIGGNRRRRAETDYTYQGVAV